MRVLFTTYAARPHFFPMVPLAWACVLAGHDVRMASTPSLADVIERSGLPGVTVGEDIDLDARLARGELAPKPPAPGEPPESVWERVVDNMARLQFDTALAMVDGLVDFARSWRPDVIVQDPVSYAGQVAGEVIGVPTVGHLYGMARVPRLELTDLWSGTEPRPGFRDLFHRFGVEARPQPAAWIDPRPGRLRWPETDPDRAAVPSHSMRYIPYNGPGTLPDHLAEPPDRPRVCVTWGTTQQKKLGAGVVQAFRDHVRAIAELGVEVLITVGAADRPLLEHLGELPDGVGTVGWVPLHMLLSRCAAIVHTGGTGTVMTAAACGVPQLGITSIPEGRFNTDRLAATGAGIHLEEAETGPEEIRDAVRELVTEPGRRDAALRLRAEMAAQPSPVDVVPELEKLELAKVR
jgi:UDP:flavonoid glycosyltransferase YjiC (YdhE family)